MPETSVLLGFVKKGIKAVPQTKYALGVVGVISAAVIVQQLLNSDFERVLPVFLIMLGCMFLLFLFAALVSIGGAPVKVLLWFTIALVIAVGSLLVSSVFFDRPKSFPLLLCTVASVRCTTVPVTIDRSDPANLKIIVDWLGWDGKRFANERNFKTLQAWMQSKGIDSTPRFRVVLFLSDRNYASMWTLAARELGIQ